MSIFVEIVTGGRPVAVSGLVEEVRWFAGEVVEVDPRRYVFAGSLRLTEYPVAPPILARTAGRVTGAPVSLMLEHALVSEWAADRLPRPTMDALRALFAALISVTPFAVVVETGRGEGSCVMDASTSRLFDTLDPIVKGNTPNDLTIVFVDE